MPGFLYLNGVYKGKFKKIKNYVKRSFFREGRGAGNNDG